MDFLIFFVFRFKYITNACVINRNLFMNINIQYIKCNINLIPVIREYVVLVRPAKFQLITDVINATNQAIG